MVRLPDQWSAERLPTFSAIVFLSVSIDQFDNFKADAPPILEAYTTLLGVKYLFLAPTASQGILPSLQHPYGPKTTQGFNRSRASCGSLLPLTTNLSVLGALQTLAQAAGCLALPTPRDALFTAFVKAALPPRVVAALDECSRPRLRCVPVSLDGRMLSFNWCKVVEVAPRHSHRDLARVTWRAYGALVIAALFLAGMLGSSWFPGLEALQNADYLLTNAVLPRLVQHPLVSAQLLVCRASVVEHRLKGK